MKDLYTVDNVVSKSNRNVQETLDVLKETAKTTHAKDGDSLYRLYSACCDYVEAIEFNDNLCDIIDEIEDDEDLEADDKNDDKNDDKKDDKISASTLKVSIKSKEDDKWHEIALCEKHEKELRDLLKKNASHEELSAFLDKLTGEDTTAIQVESRTHTVDTLDAQDFLKRLVDHLANK